MIQFYLRDIATSLMTLKSFKKSFVFLFKYNKNMSGKKNIIGLYNCPKKQINNTYYINIACNSMNKIEFYL